MGTVYLARDSRLGRQVALKFIATDRAAGSAGDARQRLLREARAASVLNHPSICQVYDVGGEGREAWIAMEYVEGASLASVIRTRGPLPAAEVMALGRQIAEALAHAHHRGVLHRDLKGANIVCDRDGRPKILDFGIARQLVQHIADEVTRASVTGTGAAIEGTLPYMAPEAIRGEPQDERSDLWSLGVVLYEMCTGQLPFQGRNSLDLAAAIVNGSPAPIPDGVPQPLALVLSRLLSRDPSARHGTAAEVAAALGTSEATVVSRRPGAGLSRTVVITAAIVLTAIAAWAIWRLPRGTALTLTEQRLINTRTSPAQSPGYSPDRSMLAYIAPDAGGVQQVWVQQLEAGTSIQVTSGTANASRPRWLPANRILFALAGQGIWTVTIGGTPTRLVERGTNPNVSRDGRFIVFEIVEAQRSIWIAAADGSGARKVEGLQPPLYNVPMWPALSPDGSTIAYFRAELGPNGDFWTIPASGGTPTRLTSDFREGGSPAWTPDGRALVFSSARAGSRTLWQVAAGGGEPTPLTVGAGEDDQPDITGDGRHVAYTNQRNSWELKVKDLTSGEERSLLQRGIELLFPMFSPDGTRIAYFGRSDYAVAVFTIGVGGNDLRQLTAGRDLNHMPRWGADGRDVYFFQGRPDPSFRRVPALGGPSSEFRKWEWETSSMPYFDPTGRFIAYLRQRPAGAPMSVTEHTVIHEVATGQERVWPEPHLHPGGWSADGESIVGWQHDAKGGAVAVCTVADGRCRQVTTGRMPRWSAHDGRLYFVRNGSGGVQDLWTITADGADERRVFTLGTFRQIDTFFDVSKTGQVAWAPFQQGDRQVWTAAVR